MCPWLPGQLVQRGHLGEPLVGQLAGRPVAHGGEAGPLGRRLAGAVLAAEQPAGEREERQEAEAHALALGEDAVLGLAVEDVVLVLHADEARGAGWRGGGRLLEQLRR